MNFFAHATLQKILKYAGIGLLLLLAILILFSVFATTINTRTTSNQSVSVDERDYFETTDEVGYGAAYAPGTMPMPDDSYQTSNGYTTDLEAYETTDYTATARTRNFEEACGVLQALKESDTIHFKSLTASGSTCNAVFFAETSEVQHVLEQLRSISSVEITEYTTSVTKARKRIASQLEILEEQLASTETTLSQAETQYTELMALARTERDPRVLSEIVREKIAITDQLTNRRIALSSQIEATMQRSADLKERIAHPQFTVTISKAYGGNAQKVAYQWERAWNSLQDTFTAVKIGLTVYIGVLLLRIVQVVVYALILLIIVRFGWKFVQKIWRE